MNQTVDVITPCYNGVKYIADCIESVIVSVTFNSFTINHFVIDDGSTDGSVALLEKIEYPHLTKIFLSQNGGHAAARNRGLAAAKGEFVFFLDADDILFQNSLRYLIEFAVRQNHDWVYGDFVRGNNSGSYLIGEDYYGWEFKSRKELLLSMYGGGHFFQQNSFFARRILSEVDGFDTELDRAVDFDLCTRLILAGRMPAYLAGPLYMHRFHDANLSHKHRSDSGLHRKQIAALFKRHEKEMQNVLSREDISKIQTYLS